eukprot:m.39440 g.39440  ORF g.39440 m.39440 type:complete len:66 (+) comp32742_c0_seq1:189-386(+)
MNNLAHKRNASLLLVYSKLANGVRRLPIFVSRGPITLRFPKIDSSPDGHFLVLPAASPHSIGSHQ